MTWPSPRTLVLGALTLLAVAAIAGGAWFWQSSQQQRALAAYAAAMTRVQHAHAAPAPPEERAAAVGVLEATLATYPSAPGAAQAAFHLGNLRYAAKQYPQARAAFEVVIARSAPGTLRRLSRAAIGYTWEAERDYARAADVFRVAAGEVKPGEFYYEELLLDLARLQDLAGRRPEAIETYQRLLKDRPQSPRAAEVRARLASLGVTVAP